MRAIRILALAGVVGSTSGWAAPAPPAASAPTLDRIRCDNRPVVMVVEGVTIDRGRMTAYADAIRQSKLYDSLGGYYLNFSRPVEVFEGNPPAGQSILLVRFPCLAHARAFWFSRAYQDAIKPLRMDPSAGEYTVSVYAERDLPPELAGRVRPGGYSWQPRPDVIAAIPQTPAFNQGQPK